MSFNRPPNGVYYIRSAVELRAFVNLLKKFKGYATTLITLYINAERPIPDVVNLLRSEWSTAANIKDKTTRTHVQDTLERIINNLKGEAKAPENGMAVFAGFHMINQGNYEWVYYVVIPPQPINTFKYICDTAFHTELLEDQLHAGVVYGIVVIERGEAVIALLKGGQWEVVKSVEFFVPGKHHAGGQSANRFKRQTEHLAEAFYKMVAEEANKIFLQIPTLKGIIVAGPGPTKEDFLEEGGLDYRLKDKILAIVPACCANEYGVMEAIRNAQEQLKESEYVKAKEVMDKVMYYAVKKSEYLVYGRERALKALEMGIADIIVIAEELGEDAVLEVIMKAEEKGIKVEVVPRGVEESKTLMQAFGGYVALLSTPVWVLEQQLSIAEAAQR
ncbi:peptide chain release factor aRF-1 [Pyrobaculum aerophilum]|uniref:Peptide chain release factor subunit 1 n=2 Tax=Pyrobaculum aerophilum TaxID=13773 RepID=RF1_PYRAE|nr:peptide chain release factor aRF-1 [Pyrobaculum aerophilum]Q8ZU81.1 RecName: Full=Peptide chain release factor subunit 1; AltName: Full=Translation termination factor aRF1 [Pyrobaculum aerophilum str. IM2]AAL64527.1 peptide chain release factor aRF subunit 1 [Pyrobaculum aerophilum str. IM2]MCX8136081.1 peptide chain release factor aRF-1 [Pyrobaculum aerophilum]HII47371.1 peptide chain release factor 1 [Pyrobaculum aerophilum]